jgi:hypothetical protein
MDSCEHGKVALGSINIGKYFAQLSDLPSRRTVMHRNSTSGHLSFVSHWNAIFSLTMMSEGARGNVVGWGTMLQAGRLSIWVPDEVDTFNLPNPSSRTMALRSTHPLGLTAFPPSVSRMSENMGASTSRKLQGLQGLHSDNFTFTFTFYDEWVFILPLKGRRMRKRHGLGIEERMITDLQ